MQLRFEAAPFPAATVCNLNAFKYSELIQYEEIREGFDYWERVINAKAMNKMLRKEKRVATPVEIRRRRKLEHGADGFFDIHQYSYYKTAVVDSLQTKERKPIGL
ncbi:hypothetical protein DICVIV_01097 [Dictyocaulus viviparus]|uniref:Uncharacterized protein n=1 Tax=Dictyocaulus viviparus TaxID=29172 RepID=A0A0D8Y7E9_DICVI|nr:hypothetical protein DICVIV_01097 [Dictyocaulus viviparus]